MFCVPVCLCAVCIHGTHRSQGRVIDLDLELQMAVIYHVYAEKQTQVLCKSSHCLNCWLNSSVHRSDFLQTLVSSLGWLPFFTSLFAFSDHSYNYSLKFSSSSSPIGNFINGFFFEETCYFMYWLWCFYFCTENFIFRVSLLVEFFISFVFKSPSFFKQECLRCSWRRLRQRMS